MFLSKSLISTAVVLLSATLQVSAHAAVSPVLGVAGTPVRSDVQRPSKARPCGKTNIAATMETSDSITMNADNTFTATITNFNRLLDGSREIASALVDTTGTGEQFNQQATILDNGTRAPKELGSEQLTVSLPAACTGGSTQNKCLVSFKTASGFGNCVVVQNAASNSTETDSATDSTATDSATDSTATDSATDSTATDSASDSTATDSASDSTATDTATDSTATDVASSSTDTAVLASGTAAAAASTAAVAASTGTAAVASSTGTTTGITTTGKKAAERFRAGAQSGRLVRRRAGPYRLDAQ